MKVNGRGGTVLVLGASRGLGRAIAEGLALAEFRVGVGCRRMDDAQAVTSAIERNGGKAIPIRVDVTQSEDVAAAVRTLMSSSERLDGLINNAGVIQPIGTISDTDPLLWAQAVQANLMGAYYGVRHALPYMSEGSVVINISSGAASVPMEGWSAYCCSKAGLAMLTRMIQHEYSAAGILAYGFRPGVVDTDMQADIRASGINPISKLARADLLPATVPAQVVTWLLMERPRDLAGEEIDIRDPRIRDRVSSLAD